MDGSNKQGPVKWQRWAFGKPRISIEKIEAIIKLYKEGVAINQIQRELKTSKETIYKCLNNYVF